VRNIIQGAGLTFGYLGLGGVLIDLDAQQDVELREGYCDAFLFERITADVTFE
jgi:hypothetical protein